MADFIIRGNLIFYYLFKFQYWLDKFIAEKRKQLVHHENQYWCQYSGPESDCDILKCGALVIRNSKRHSVWKYILLNHDQWSKIKNERNFNDYSLYTEILNYNNARQSRYVFCEADILIFQLKLSRMRY
jgi:hypothetical protein